ncbi:thioesterase domain-containing protein [Alcanivorax sp. S6407]|uniref:YiiD C-terminal domain-containing protein n=1 Tax=Alcanivorax sp. S6407 TaxID=2926424 RepID=UPI001FF53DA3|nr:YiiD C-terminal domain-containing protein [Alcanivorax sp. S6407]MCK0152899.1 thioesterase domain-containing protein [Alcanivorax sp. S6407]
MISLDTLAEQVRDAIPLTRHLHFRFEEFDGDRLVLCAPLGPNHNDKGTFFAGSQSALLTLAGWSLTTLLAHQCDLPADVVAVETQLKYTLPLDSDLRITVTTEQRQRFEQRLEARGKASLRITAVGCGDDGKTVCEFTAAYLARR